MTIGATLEDQIYKEGESTWGCKYGVVDVEDLKKSIVRIRGSILSELEVAENIGNETSRTVGILLKQILKEMDAEFGLGLTLSTGESK